MKKKGISLIMLIITIIVVIILAAVVILTLSKNNPIESAKEARFKEDVRTFQDELALAVSKQYANAGGHWDGNISAKTYDEIINYIPSFTKKYEGKFIINNNNLEYMNKLDEKEKEYAQNLNVKKRESILPDEYQQVEYIESSGTQWIDTQWIPSSKAKVLVDGQYTLTSNELNRAQSFGTYGGLSWTDNSTTRFYCPRWNAWDKYYRIILGSTVTTENTAPDTQRHKFIADRNTSQYMIDDEVFQTNDIITDCETKFMLFCNSYSQTVENHCYFKLFNAKAYEDNVMIRDFIPCYSTTTVTDIDGNQCQTGTIGMYDTVEGKFYINQGTGEDFKAGPDVD